MHLSIFAWNFYVARCLSGSRLREEFKKIVLGCCVPVLYFSQVTIKPSGVNLVNRRSLKTLGFQTVKLVNRRSLKTLGFQTVKLVNRRSLKTLGFQTVKLVNRRSLKTLGFQTVKLVNRSGIWKVMTTSKCRSRDFTF